MATSEPNRTDFDALILHTDSNWVVLDSTWFEADTPAATGDRGWLRHGDRTLPVTTVDGDGVHHLATAAELHPGERVRVTIDRGARDLRRRSAALQNLLRSLLHAHGEWRPALRRGSTLSLQQGWAADVPDLGVLRGDLEALILEDHRIWRTPDEASGVVYWQVDGVATIADSTLSVDRTSEVGPFALRFAEVSGRLCIFAEALPLPS
jgi:Ser-tRNA(Ala) deacylase AlaX